MGRFVLPLQQVFTLSGRLGAGYKLHFYSSGTSTPLDTFSDAGLSIANPNPMIADAEGRFDDIFLSNVPYKVTLSDEDDVLIWTADPVQTATGELGVPIPLDKGGTGATDVPGIFAALGLGDAATYDVGDGADEIPTNSMISGVPTGGIIMWSGSLVSLPSGWALCNGGTYSKSDGSGTITAPDLRDRFVMGAGTTYAVNATGGAASVTSGTGGGGGTVTTSAAGAHSHGGATQGHTLTTAEIPSHRHQQTTGQGSSGGVTGWNVVSNATVASTSLYTDYAGGGGSHTHGLDAAPDHTHTIATTDHTHTVAIQPPFLALGFIMKL